MKEFETTYPLDRSRQLQHLVKNNLISDVAVGLLNRLAAAYGCIARDLGMFPTEQIDTIMLTWNVPITDIREGGRKRNSVIANVILSPEMVLFQDGTPNSPPATLSWDSPELTNIIQRYRTAE